MNRAYTDDATHSRMPATRSVAVLAVLIATGLPMAALAQGNAQRPSDSQALDPQPQQSHPWQAPVGHHQPRPSDLPPSVLQAEEGGGGTQGQGEGGRTQAQEKLDQDLRICKGC
jgi:hypothetical protein